MINPYNELQKIIRDEGSIKNPPTMIVGKVLSVEPLHIVAEGTPLYKNNLYINKSLLDYSQNFNINVNATIDNDNRNIIISNGKINLKTTLHEGSLVAMQSINDKQKYIVLCEVI